MTRGVWRVSIKDENLGLGAPQSVHESPGWKVLVNLKERGQSLHEDVHHRVSGYVGTRNFEPLKVQFVIFAVYQGRHGNAWFALQVILQLVSSLPENMSKLPLLA